LSNSISNTSSATGSIEQLTSPSLGDSVSGPGVSGLGTSGRATSGFGMSSGLGASGVEAPADDPQLELQARIFREMMSGPRHLSSLPLTSQPASEATAEVQASAAAADPEPTFAELVERHVRRMLAAQATSRQESGEVRLELTDAVLPQTQLSLRRGSDGWQLLAVTGDRGSLERLERFAPALVGRFANASLGSLEVVTRLES
jgi:hypothetical protein